MTLSAKHTKHRMEARRLTEQGQALAEFAISLPLVLLLVLGIIEMSYALFDQHVVVKLAREGSNLISRNTTLVEAGTTMQRMADAPPVTISPSSTTSLLIFSVIQAKATSPHVPVLYKKYAIGSTSTWQSVYTATPASGAGCDFTAGEDYADSHDDGCLIVGGSSEGPDGDGKYTAVLPDGVRVREGNRIYMTEVYNRHNLITPAKKFGVNVPNALYGRAIF